jgi:hypothetical protein
VICNITKDEAAARRTTALGTEEEAEIAYAFI